MERIFSAEGYLAKIMAAGGRRFEARPEQMEMATAIATSIRTRSHLLVEAGTGTGKSYAYLLPFLLWALEKKKRVLVATGTKALQQQLVERDLPFLRDLFAQHYGQEVRFALCLGTGNYICPRRLAKTQVAGLFDSAQSTAQMAQIQAFAAKTPTGRNLDLPFEPLPGLWAQVNRESDLCLGRNCPTFENSFFYKARREQEKAHILVANHHLLFAHIAAGGNAGGVLPPFDALVIDEAHHAEDVAAAYLGMELSNLGAAKLVELVANKRSGRTVLHGVKWPGSQELEKKLHEGAAEAREAVGRFFENLQAVVRFEPNRSSNIRVKQPNLIENCLEAPLERLEFVLKEARLVAEGESDEATLRELEGFGQRCAEMRRVAKSILGQTESGYVYWASCVPRLPDGPGRSTRVPRLAVHGAPVEVAEAMRVNLFQAFRPVILTSATMTTGGSFEFLMERLGLAGWDGAPEVAGAVPAITVRHLSIPSIPSRPPGSTSGPEPVSPLSDQVAAAGYEENYEENEEAEITVGPSPEGVGEPLDEQRVPTRTLVLGSPFDFKNHTLIYLGADLPDPAHLAYWEEAAIKRAAEVLKRTNGRAFILCTSYKMVDQASRFLEMVMPPHIRILRQGQMARGKLLSEFRTDTHSVLVGTTSFWQGVDVPGESLSCVIIMKLPFAVPDEPLIAARVESLKQRGRDAFMEYQVPQAVMMFRQGFGRLIRTAEDRGVVAILDPRVRTKRYGQTFLDSLPETEVTNDLERVTSFCAAQENTP